LVNQRWEESVSEEKPFNISKKVVWEAYQRVRANKTGYGYGDVGAKRHNE
jgi:hypothetical protein